MPKRVTVTDFCEHYDSINITVDETVSGDDPHAFFFQTWPLKTEDKCSECGYLNRIIDLDLGDDPAALLERAAETVGIMVRDGVSEELLQAAAEALWTTAM